MSSAATNIEVRFPTGLETFKQHICDYFQLYLLIRFVAIQQPPLQKSIVLLTIL